MENRLRSRLVADVARISLYGSGMADALLFTYRAQRRYFPRIPNFGPAPRAVKVRSLPSKFSPATAFASTLKLRRSLSSKPVERRIEQAQKSEFQGVSTIERGASFPNGSGGRRDSLCFQVARAVLQCGNKTCSYHRVEAGNSSKRATFYLCKNLNASIPGLTADCSV